MDTTRGQDVVIKKPFLYELGRKNRLSAEYTKHVWMIRQLVKVFEHKSYSSESIDDQSGNVKKKAPGIAGGFLRLYLPSFCWTNPQQYD
jgi:hypothetical protein